MKKTNLTIFLIISVLTAVIFAGCGKSQDVNEEKPTGEDIQNETPAGTDSEGDKDSESISEYGVEINEDNVVFTDSRGEEVTVSKNPQRVVVLQNSLLDIWDSCGGAVVGRVEATEEKPVENALSAEIVGSVGTPSLEKILSLEPDLVVVASSYSGQRDMIPALEQSNIEVIALDNDLKEDYYKTLRLFSGITGREDLYENLMVNVKEGIDEIIAEAPADKGYKVVVLFATSKSITTRDSKTMVGEMLKDLNAVNIADSDDDSADTKTFSMEKILEEDPDFIFVQTMGSDLEKITERLKADAESNPAWASLTAVKENRYIVLPKDLYLYKPNSRYAEAYEGLAEILYSEVYN